MANPAHLEAVLNVDSIAIENLRAQLTKRGAKPIIDLTDADLRNRTLPQGMSLTNANLSGADLRGATISATLNGRIFSEHNCKVLPL